MTWPNDLPFVWNSLQRGHPPHSGVHNTLQSAMWWGIIKATMIIVVCTSSTLHNVGLLDKDFWPSIWLPVRIPQGALFLNWSLMDHIGYHSASLLPEAPHVHYKSKTEEEVTKINNHWLMDVIQEPSSIWFHEIAVIRESVMDGAIIKYEK